MTSPQAPPERPPDPGDAALADAVAALHAAIYGYGLVSAHSEPERNDLVSASLREHRARRETVVAALAARGVIAPVAAAGYSLPHEVGDPRTAAELALRMETDTAVAWRAVAEQSGRSEDRALAADALAGCAVRAARWRRVLGRWPMTEPFPGGAE